jgi:GT2 family glycosyltransferase
MKEKEKIAAIVVTYNRKDLLRECLNSLLNQTRIPDSIIIMDNASTDGTKEMLEKEFLDNSIFDYVNLGENLGGAGGFYYGIKKACEKKFDWMWLMDDDGFADKTQLKILYKYNKTLNIDILNPLVLDKDNEERLAFFKNSNFSDKRTLLKKNKGTILWGTITPVNGTLLSKKVVKKIGNIKKEMFIWGDEKEYIFRAKKEGFEVATILNAFHFHPPTQSNYQTIYINTLLKKFKGKVEIKPDDKMHIFSRNLGYINSNYRSKKNHFKFLIYYSIYFIFFRKNIKLLITFYKYYYDGYKNYYKLPIFKRQ